MPSELAKTSPGIVAAPTGGPILGSCELGLDVSLFA